MLRFRNVTTLCAAGLLALACDTTSDSGVGGADSGGGGGGGADGGVTGDAGGTGDCLQLTAFTTIDTPTTFTANCEYNVRGNLIVDSTLTLEPGVTINFDDDAEMSVSVGSPGMLIARGTAAMPVTLRGQDAMGNPQRWSGINFLMTTPAGQVLENVVFQRCGDADSTGEACIGLTTTADDIITLDTIRFEDVGLGIHALRGHLDNPTGLTFDDDSTVAMILGANLVGDIEEAFTFGAASELRITNAPPNNRVNETATWIAQSIPWQAGAEILVQAPEDNAPTPELTLGEGLQLWLASGGELTIADQRPGALNIAGTATDPVVIQAADATAREAGEIQGIYVNDDATSIRVNYLDISHGGLARSGACLEVTDVAQTATVSISNSTFRDCLETGVATLDADVLRFGEFDNNTFDNTITGFSVRPDTIPSITSNQTYTGTVAYNLVLPGPVERDGRWRAQTIPYRLQSTNARRDLEIGAEIVVEAPSVYEVTEELIIHVGENSDALFGTDAPNGGFTIFRPADTNAGWRGIVYYPQSSGSALTNAEIIGGGNTFGNLITGCVAIRGGTQGIGFVNVTFRQCMNAGIGAVDDGPHFGTMTNIRFVNQPAGYRVHAESVGDLDPGQNTYTGVVMNELVAGDVSRPAMWRDHGIPWNVVAPFVLEVETILTIMEGTRIRFPRTTGAGSFIEVGIDNPGALNLMGVMGNPVVLTSAEPNPAAGDWNGITFGVQTMPSTLSTFILSNAGQGMRAAIRLNGQMNVQIADGTFTDILGGVNIEP